VCHNAFTYGLRRWAESFLDECIPFAAVRALAEPFSGLIAAILADKNGRRLFRHNVEKNLKNTGNSLP